MLYYEIENFKESTVKSAFGFYCTPFWENIFLPNQRIIILQGLEKDAGRTLSNEMLRAEKNEVRTIELNSRPHEVLLTAKLAINGI